MGIGRGVALNPAVFFDRDGVLNEAIVRNGRPYPPASVDELRIDAMAAPAIARLRACGFSIVVITNQPDVARGTTSRASVEAINERVASHLAVDAVYTCFHDSHHACACRKPKPGMLVAAARDLGLDLAASYVVGDRWSDVAAGREARCKTVWIERGYDERQPTGADARVATLESACEWIINDYDRT